MENENMTPLLEQIRQAQKEQQCMAGRLLSVEKQIKGMNVYYAVFASVTAVLGLIYPQTGFVRLSAVMTVILSLLVITLSTQKYAQQARQYHANAHMLGQLLLEAAEEDGRTVREKYGVLTAFTEAQSTQEHRAVLRMRDIENHRRVLRGEEVLKTHYLCGYEKFKYWFGEIAAVVFSVLIFLAPVAGAALAAMSLI